MALGYPTSWHYIIYNGPDKTQSIQNFPCITILNVLFQHLFSMANLALNEDYLQYIQDLHVQAKATNAIILHSKATKLQTVNCSNLITKSSKNIPESWIQPCKGQDLPNRAQKYWQELGHDCPTVIDHIITTARIRRIKYASTHEYKVLTGRMAQCCLFGNWTSSGHRIKIFNA